MIDLYISKYIYDTCQEGTELYLLLHNKATQIWLDIDGSELDELIPLPNDDELTESKNQGNRTPRSGKIMLDCMKEGKPIKHGLSKAIVILDDITEDKAKEITTKYGLLCFTFNNLEERLKCLKIKSKFLTTTKDWEFFFAPFKDNNVPCNSLIFIDRYLGTLDKYCNNINDILLQNITNAPISTSFHVLIISLNTNVFWHDKVKEVCVKLIKKMTVKCKGCEFLLELITLNENSKDPLYGITHNRKIFSNYWNLDAPHMIDAYYYKREDNKLSIQKSNAFQSIQVQGLFADGFNDNEYIQSEEEAQNAVLKILANEFKGGSTPLNETTEINNSGRTYSAYRINKNSTEKIINNNQIIILNRLIMDKINLKNGARCKYLSLPYCNDWKNISTKQGEYKENGEYDNCIVVKVADFKILNEMTEKIKKLFTDNKYPQVDGEYGHYYRIVTTYPSDLKTIHVISSKKCEKPCNQYEGNRFKDVSDAMERCNEIAKILGMGERYSKDLIKKVKDITSHGFFFLPYIPTSDKFSFFNKRMLIIGASHNCPHSKDCPYFGNCTSSDMSHGNSRSYNNICPYKETGDNNLELPLEETTKNTVKSFFNKTNEEQNVSFRNFTDFMNKYFNEEKNEDFDRSFWSHVAFINYAQNFESQKRGNHFSDEDYEAFKQYMEIIKPDVVIIWGCDLGNELRKRGVKPGEEDKNIEDTVHYYWKINEGLRDVEFINCYHPCKNMSLLEDYGKFSKALDKIFKNNGR